MTYAPPTVPTEPFKIAGSDPRMMKLVHAASPGKTVSRYMHDVLTAMELIEGESSVIQHWPRRSGRATMQEILNSRRQGSPADIVAEPPNLLRNAIRRALRTRY